MIDVPIHRFPCDLTAAGPDQQTGVVRPQSDRVVLPIRGVDIIDGDSIAVEFGVRQTVRLQGIDTPEKRKPNEAEAADVARRAVNHWYVEHQPVLIVWSGYDKFGGRNLGDVIGRDGTSLSQWLLSRRLARPYHGERKQPWSQQDLDLIVAQAGDFPAEPAEGKQ